LIDPEPGVAWIVRRSIRVAALILTLACSVSATELDEATGLLASSDHSKRAVRISAGRALAQSGSLDAAGSVLKMIATLDASDGTEGVMRWQFLYAFVKRKTWMANAPFQKRLLASLSESDKHMLSSSSR
jgi:hypothetical protein